MPLRTRLVLLFLVFLMLSASTCYAAASSIKMCFLFPTPLSDLGFTHNTHASVVAIKKKMEAKYPSTAITNVVRFNQIQSPNLTRTLVELATLPVPCTMILLCSRSLVDNLPNGTINPIAQRYPHVLFWVFSTPVASAVVKPANVLGCMGNPTPTWFAAGAAIAVECRSCVALMVPFAAQRFVANAIYKGMLFGAKYRSDGGANFSSVCPVIALELGGFSNPTSERAFARAAVLRGCSTIAVFSDTYEVSKSVQLRDPRGSILTVAGNVDGGLVVGDTVLTSVFFTFLENFEYLTESLILGQTPNHGRTQAPVLGSISPLARAASITALSDAQRQLAANISLLYCGDYVNQQGARMLPRGECFRNVSQYNSQAVLLQNMTQLGTFPSPLRCPPGTFCSYNFSGDMSLQCLVCQANTYTAQSGLFACTPCPAGLVSKPNASACVMPASEADPPMSSQHVKVLIGVLVPLAVLIAAGLLYLLLCRRRGAETTWPAWVNDNTLLAFAVIDLDPQRCSAGWRQHVQQDFSILRSAVQKMSSVCDTYIVFSSPTTIFLAAQRPKGIFRVVEGVEEQLQKCHVATLATRAVIHYGDAMFLAPRVKETLPRFVGPAVDVLQDVRKSKRARLGQLTITNVTWHFLKAAVPNVESRMTNAYKLHEKKPTEISCVRVLFGASLKGVHEDRLQGSQLEVSVDVSTVDRALKDSLIPKVLASADPAAASSRMLSQAQVRQLSDMCSLMLTLFLCALPKEHLARTHAYLQRRFGLIHVVSGDPKQQVRHVCASIAPGLVGTLDEVHVLDVIRTMSRKAAKTQDTASGRGSIQSHLQRSHNQQDRR